MTGRAVAIVDGITIEIDDVENGREVGGFVDCFSLTPTLSRKRERESFYKTSRLR